MSWNRRRSSTWSLVALLLLACGCQRYLVETPNLLFHEDWRRTSAAATANYQTSDIDVVYATDRAIDETNSDGPKYGYKRSRWLAFGTATVAFDPRPTWQQLRDDSLVKPRKQAYALRVDRVQEQGRFGFVVDCLRPSEFGLEMDPKAAGEEKQQVAKFHNVLRERLAASPQKDVYLFIHGYNASFDDAVFRPAEVWHFLGRVGVPVAYTWPAGFSGLRGYAYDRESGEFTIFHLKNFIKKVAACPEVERIHLVAHSRGSDVTITALRELNIECQAKGESTRVALKIENLVLAAPDLDEDVFMQRFAAENMLAAANRTTIYASRRDRAIEAADYLFGSRRRLGALGARDFSPRMREMLARLPNLQFIECNVKTPSILNSHDYVFSNAAALSDLILVLRDRRPPGADNGRPLLAQHGIWELRDDYPHLAPGAIQNPILPVEYREPVR